MCIFLRIMHIFKHIFPHNTKSHYSRSEHRSMSEASPSRSINTRFTPVAK